MECLISEQRWQIVKIYYQNQCSVRQIYRALREFYSVWVYVIAQLNNVFTELSTNFERMTRKAKTVRFQENNTAVVGGVEEDSNLSFHRR